MPGQYLTMSLTDENTPAYNMHASIITVFTNLRFCSYIGIVFKNLLLVTRFQKLAFSDPLNAFVM